MKTYLEKQGQVPVIEATNLFYQIKNQKLKQVLPLLRQALSLNIRNHYAQNDLYTTYFMMPDKSENAAYVNLIEKSLNNPYSVNKALQSNALSALSKTATKAHKRLFLQVLKVADNRYLRYGDRSAAEGLYRLSTKKDVNDWKKLLNFHKSSDVKRIAAEALLKYGARDEVKRFASTTTDSELKTSLNTLLLK